MKFILTVNTICFIDPTMNDVLDGTFRVFGKVTRVVSDNSESIDLMRKSSSGKFSGFIEELVSRMGSATGDVPFQGDVSETKVSGPTLQVILIAIFA